VGVLGMWVDWIDCTIFADRGRDDGGGAEVSSQTRDLSTRISFRSVVIDRALHACEQRSAVRGKTPVHDHKI